MTPDEVLDLVNKVAHENGYPINSYIVKVEDHKVNIAFKNIRGYDVMIDTDDEEWAITNTLNRFFA